MSQAVANTKQFAQNIKTGSLSDTLGGRNVPGSFTKKSTAKNPNPFNPYELRAKKKQFKKTGKGEVDVEATQALQEKIAAQKFGRYFDDPSLRSRQFSPEAMAEAEGVVKDFKSGPYADDVDSEPIKVDSERIF